MSHARTGRNFEGRIAKLIGGKHLEKEHYGDSQHDVESDQLIGECKLRASLAVETWMVQCEGYAKSGKTCVLFAKAKRKHDDKTLVVMRLPDFLRLMDEGEGK